MAKANKFENTIALEHRIKFFKSLPEKQRRHFIAIEYLSLETVSQRFLAATFGCSRQVITDGLIEVNSPDFKPDYTRQRQKGAGRKKKRKPLRT